MLTYLKAIRGRATKIAQARLRRTKSRFGNDTQAVAAIEFAIVASVLLMILLGICDIAPAWLVYNNAGTSASTAADVTAEFSEMKTSDMVDVYSAAADVMQPFSATPLSLRITNVFSDGNGNAKVYWSCGVAALPAYTALSSVTTTPTGSPVGWFLWVYNTTSGGYTLNGTNTSYVMAEIKYSYTAPAQFVLKSAIPLSGVAYYMPRLSSYVGFPWDGVSSDAPTVPTAAHTSASVTLSNGAVCNYAK
jgi:Flp pilus assembly protein TadG